MLTRRTNWPIKPFFTPTCEEIMDDATSLYIVESGSAQNAAALKVWFKEAVDHTGPGSRPNELVIPLTQNQAYGLGREHGITTRPVSAPA